MGISVIEGLVSGVAAGLVLAAFFWAIDICRKASERKKQVRHLSSIISDHRKKMYKPTLPIDLLKELASDPFVMKVVSELAANTDVLRKGLFRSMKLQLIAALDGRCSRLTFDEIHQLRTLLETIDELLDMMPPSRERLWTDEFCGKLFDGIEGIKWLNLPEGPDFYESGAERNDDD